MILVTQLAGSNDYYVQAVNILTYVWNAAIKQQEAYMGNLKHPAIALRWIATETRHLLSRRDVMSGSRVAQAGGAKLPPGAYDPCGGARLDRS